MFTRKRISSAFGLASSLSPILLAFMIPTPAYASATNCDYKTWYGYSTGNSGDYSQCMTVRGKSDSVSEIKGSVHQWVQPGLGPGSPVSIPNLSNICTTIQFKYKTRGSQKYTYSSKEQSCHKPAYLNHQNRVYKPRYSFYLANHSDVCMRYKNEKTAKRYTDWTCIQIKK